MRTVPRAWTHYTYYDPCIVLPKLQLVREALSNSETPDHIKNLRTNRLKRERESWEAAIFCRLLSLAYGHDIFFCREEDEDFDSIFTWSSDEGQNYAPIQLKELVPTELNAQASLSDILDGIRAKYHAPELIVGVRLNQRTQFNPRALDVSGLEIGELWMFGVTAPDQSKWSLFGEFLSGNVEQHEFNLGLA